MAVARVWAAYRGPQHVIIACDIGMLEDLGFDPRGMPTREAYNRPGDDEYQALMDRVYATGQPIAVRDARAPDGTSGRLVIVPLRDDVGVWGLSVLWIARPRGVVPLPSAPPRRPALHESA